jgi:hypothetical protein
MVQPDKPQTTIWRMRIACKIPKATNAHAEYVIVVAVPLQQWLDERAAMLCYTYVACRVVSSFRRWLTVVKMYTTSLVGVVSKLQAGQPTNRDFIPCKARDFSSTQTPRRGLKPTVILFGEYCGWSGRGREAHRSRHIERKLTKSGAISPYPYMPSWRTEGISPVNIK